MNETRQPISIAEYASIVWQRRKVALLATGLFCCLTLVAFNFVPRKYASQAEFERRGDSVAARTDKAIPESFRNFKPVLKNELGGQTAVRAALDDLGYFNSLPHQAGGDLAPEASAKAEETIARLMRDLDVQWEVNSDNVDRISVAFRCSDPAMAYKLPNQLVANYIRKTTQELRDQLTSSCTFLTQQVASARAKIDNLRSQQFKFTADHPDMMPDNPQFMVDRLAQTDTELDDLRQRRKAVESQIETLKSMQAQGGEMPILASANPAYASAANELNQLKKQLSEALTIGQMTPKHPKVIKLQEAIAAAQENLKNLASVPYAGSATATLAAADGKPMELTLMLNDLDRVNNQIARKEEIRARYEKSQANLLPVMQDYQRLNNQITDVEKEAKEWQVQLAEVQMALNAETNGSRTHFRQVKMASPVYQPAWPPLWLMFGAAFTGAPAFGIVLVILMARFTRTFSSAEHARASLGMPVLGVIGPILSPAHSRIRSLRKYALMPAVASIMLALTVLAGIGVVMASRYPERYAQIMDQAGPTARSMWTGVQSLLGSV